MNEAIDTVGLVTKGVRSQRRVWGGIGAFMLLFGLALIALAMTAKGSLMERVAGASFFGLMFALPGGLLLRKWLQPLSSAPMVQLLTTRRSDIVRAYPRYVKYGSGPTTAELHLVDKEGKDHSAQVPLIHIKAICNQLSRKSV